VVALSQTDIYKLLSDVPVTQKQLVQATGVSTGQISHELRCLVKKGMAIRQTLDVRSRPYGYTKAKKAPEREVMRWPRY
jgi:DNA-binding transcriptional regulator GbsR (MarR family)